MSLPDFVLPILGFGIIINSVISSTKTGVKSKEVIELIIGFFICCLSIWTSVNNSDSTDKLQTIIIQSNEKADSLISMLKTDSINNFNFQKYLKDSLGIKILDKVNNKVELTNVYYNIINIKTNENKPLISDSSNVEFYFSTNGRNFIAFPKIGMWQQPFISLEEKFRESIFVNGTSINDPKVIFVNGKKYKIVTTFTGIISTKDRPLVLEINKNQNISIFFGDDSDTNKRYLYENGKIYWVPNIKI